MLQAARSGLEVEQQRSAALKRRLDKEEADVEKLTGLSLAGLFHSILGDRTERMQKEKQEAIAARLKYDDASQAVVDALDEVEHLSAELQSLEGVEEEYAELLDRKAAILLERSDEQTHKLMACDERISDLKSDEKELVEAVTAGDAALDALNLVDSDLAAAGDWGTLDLVGGGLISGLAKHSKFDSAKAHAERAQRLLLAFSRELVDAGERLDLSIDVGGFTKFADFFFDGLIADWVVQSKIRQSQEACRNATSQASAAVNACRQKLRETRQALADEIESRQQLIADA